jgi:hypothetical protein
VCNPFIHRVGAEPNSKIQFDANNYIFPEVSCKMFDYIVVGDARTLAGLAAPYSPVFGKINWNGNGSVFQDILANDLSVPGTPGGTFVAPLFHCMKKA